MGMSETQNTKDHGAALAPGEIRTHTVGSRRFMVMHVSGGTFTQATVRDGDGPTQVLCTSQWDHKAVDAYADAIAAAEDEPDATPAGLGDVPQDRSGDGVPKIEQDADLDAPEEKTAAELLAIIREDLFRYVPGGGEQFLDRYLAAVAGAVPQRATDADGWGIWLHACGVAQSAKRGDGVCDACGAKTANDDGWRALYTLGGE